MKGYGKYKILRSCIVLLLGPWGALPLSSLRFENGIHSNENADIEMLPAKRPFAFWRLRKCHPAICAY